MKNFEKYKQWETSTEITDREKFEEAQVRKLATDLRDLIYKHIEAGLDETLTTGSILEFAAASLFLMADPDEDVEKILIGVIKKIARWDAIIKYRKK